MTRPLLTIALVAANVAVYAACLSGGLVPAHPTVGSILTSMFLHDGIVHLVGNMIFLAVFGVIVERSIGHMRLLAIYLAAGIGGALMHILVNPASTDVLVGSSGCIFGIMAVAAVLRPRMLVLVAGFVLLNVWYALAGTGGAVSFGDHLGGFAIGALFVVVARARGSLEAV